MDTWIVVDIEKEMFVDMDGYMNSCGYRYIKKTIIKLICGHKKTHKMFVNVKDS